MRWILDACCLISLVQSNIFDYFITLEKNEVVIDTSVYSEVVTLGKKKGYEDAQITETFLKKFHIPIIPNEVESLLHIFKDAGETSCYLLAKDEGVVITFDRKAYNKFNQLKIPVIKMEAYFLRKFYNHLISKEKILDLLSKLLNVNAISIKTYYFYKEQIMEVKS